MTHNVFEATFAAFRFYEDGTESGASAIAAQNNNINRIVTGSNLQVQLRVRVDETGAGTLSGNSTDDYGLEYELNSSGTWLTVTASSTHVQADTGSTLTDGAATTNRSTDGISDGAGDFQAGEQEAGNGEITDFALVGDDFTEHVFALLLIDAQLSAGDVIAFRMTYNGAAGDMVNSVEPQITMQGPFTPEADYFAFYEDGTEAASTLVYAAAQTADSAIFPANIMRNHTVAGDRDLLLRWRVQETGGTASTTTCDWKLRYSKNGGAKADVTTTSSNVRVNTGSGLTDGNASTNRLPVGTGSHVASEQEEGNGIIEDWQLTASNFGEPVFAITLQEGDLSAGDYLEFYLEYDNGSGYTAMTQTFDPTILVNTGAVIRNWREDYDGDATDAVVTVTHTDEVENDLMFAYMMLDTQTTGTWDAVTDWTEEYDQVSQNIASLATWRIAPASPPASTAFTLNGGTAEDDNFVSLRIDGHDGTTPVPTKSTNNGDSTNPIATGITTANNNALVLCCVNFDGNDFTQWIGPPTATGITFFKGGEYQSGSGGSSGSFWAFGVKATAGPIGNATWPSTTVADGWHAFMFEIKPGTVAFTSTSAQTLPSITQQATGTMHPDANGAQTLPSMEQVASAVEKLIATAIQTLPAATQQATVAEKLEATAAQTMAAITQAASVVEKLIVSSAQTLPSVEQVASAIEQIAATAAQTMPAVEQQASVTQTQNVEITSAQTLPAVEQAASVVEELIATAAQTLPAMIQAGSVSEKFIVSSVQTLAAITQTATVTMQPEATAAQTLAAITQAATLTEEMIVSSVQTLPAVTQTATITMQPEATGAQTLAAIEQQASVTHQQNVTVTSVQTLPAIIQSADVTHQQNVTVTSVQTLAAILQAATVTEELTATAAQTLPAVEQAATVTEEMIVSSVQTLPAIEQAAAVIETLPVTASQTLKALIQTASSEIVLPATGAQSLPSITQSASLQTIANIDITAAMTLPAITQSAVAIALAVQFPAEELTGSWEYLVSLQGSWDVEHELQGSWDVVANLQGSVE